VVASLDLDPGLRGREIGKKHGSIPVIGCTVKKQGGKGVATIRAEVDVHRAAIDAIACGSRNVPCDVEVAASCDGLSTVGQLQQKRSGIGRDTHGFQVVTESSATGSVVSDRTLEIQLPAVRRQMFSKGCGVVDQVGDPRKHAGRT